MKITLDYWIIQKKRQKCEGNNDPAFFSKKWVFDPFIQAMDVIIAKLGANDPSLWR